MNILPQPRQHSRQITTPNIITLACGNKSWQPPPSLVENKSIIKQAVVYNNDVYAITEEGQLICSNSSATLSEVAKQKVVQLGVMGTGPLVLLLEDKLLQYSGNFTELYSGPGISFCTGFEHLYLLTKDGYKFYGSNLYGQCGCANTRTGLQDMEHIDALEVQQLCSGGWHAYAKTKHGKFYGWGYNRDSRLGNGNTNDSHALTPILLSHDELGIHTLVPGAWHTLGLTHRGDVYVWGILTENNLGIKVATNSTIRTPQILMQGKDIINVFTCSYSASNYAQCRDGTMYIWGRNSTLQFFGEQCTAIPTPTIYEDLRGLPVRSVFIGYNSTIFTLETRYRSFVIKNSKHLSDIDIINII